jgi:SSS family solute:Na+ symporter
MVALSVYLARGQTSEADYYVGGRNLPWWAVGISTMATQSSAISFISIPAFVALKEGGGLTWLQFELAVPLAMIAVIALLLPFFRKLELISVYEYLELRYGRSVRQFLSGVFLISRGLATGVAIYAASLVLSICMGIPIWATILLIGAVTIVYDTIGGISAVVYSDVIQMAILFAGVVVCVWVAAGEVGGLTAVFNTFPAERWKALDMSTGFGDSGTPFWGFLIGGLFLYASYYGVDQSQVQRELSAKTLDGTRRSLVFNGVARFPLTLAYVLLGVAASALYLHSAELRAAVPDDQVDALIPNLLLLHLPQGVRAVVIAAILAAAMSSIDSGLNSLSAATVRDFIERGRKLSERQLFIMSKVTTVVWGVVITAFAFVVGALSDTVIEGINMIGSLFYGPILAAFIVGVLSKRASGVAMTAGVIVGVSVNLLVALALPHIFWMWWNLFGFAMAAAVSLAVSTFVPASAEKVARHTLSGSGVDPKRWLPWYLFLAVYFLVILGCLAYMNTLAV